MVEGLFVVKLSSRSLQRRAKENTSATCGSMTSSQIGKATEVPDHPISHEGNHFVLCSAKVFGRGCGHLVGLHKDRVRPWTMLRNVNPSSLPQANRRSVGGS